MELVERSAHPKRALLERATWSGLEQRRKLMTTELADVVLIASSMIAMELWERSAQPRRSA
jgi:hypothetical protein